MPTLAIVATTLFKVVSITARLNPYSLVTYARVPSWLNPTEVGNTLLPVEMVAMVAHIAVEITETEEEFPFTTYAVIPSADIVTQFGYENPVSVFTIAPVTASWTVTVFAD